MSDAKTVLKMIEENDVKYVDFRFTDPRGKWQHTAQYVTTVDEDMLSEGIMFDGSSIAGWKAINESDMILKPDLDSAVMDPFTAQPTLVLFCDIYEPSTGQPYERDPRSVAAKARAYMESLGIGDTAYFGPEAEFFVFDEAKWSTTQEFMAYKIDSEEGPYNSFADFEDGNIGPPPGPERRLLPGGAGRQRPGHAGRDGHRHGRNGPRHGKAPPRSGAVPA